MTNRRNVLIYRVGQLGDTLVALPAIQTIVRRHLGCRLVLLTDRHATARGYVSSWDVLGPTNWFDDVIYYEPRDKTPLGRLGQIYDLLLQLRCLKFEHVYNLVMRTSEQAVKRDRLFFRDLGGSQHYLAMPSVAYPPRRELAGSLPDIIPEWLRLLQGIGAGIGEAHFRLSVPDEAYAELSAVWPALDDDRHRTLVIAPGSKMSAKRWPEARFAELGQRLLQVFADLRIVIVGGSEDSALGDNLCEVWGSRSVNLSGKLSIYGSAALMARCALYVGNDTGSMHLAAMVGIPCVAIFSARDYPGLWEPYGNGHVILRRDLECSGCMLETCVERENACIKSVSVEEVLQAVLERLTPDRRGVALGRQEMKWSNRFI